MARLSGILGLLTMRVLAFMFSTNRSAMLAGTIANLMSASIAGMLL